MRGERTTRDGNWQVASPKRKFAIMAVATRGDETGREKKKKGRGDGVGRERERIINEFRGPAGFLSSAVPTLWCFDSLAVSNNIRYFYHIAAPVRLAFIRIGTRFGTRVLRYFQDSHAVPRHCLDFLYRGRDISISREYREFHKWTTLQTSRPAKFNPRASFNGFVFPRNLSIQ